MENTKSTTRPAEELFGVKTIEAARAWVEAGLPCTQRFGWAWKGGRTKDITTEKAKELMRSGDYGFGIGYYELNWCRPGGVQTLEFNELSEGDMF